MTFLETVEKNNETKVEEQKVGFLTLPKQNFLFGFDKRSFMLCQECSYVFKKYWEQYMNNNQINDI